MSKQKRVSQRIHTRKIDRAVAHYNMKKVGCVGVNKNHSGLGSFFSHHWRDEVK